MNIKKYVLLCSLALLILGIVASCKEAQGADDPITSDSLGTGQLYVYVDTWGGTEASKDEHGTYDVRIGLTYYIRIWGITEFQTDMLLTVKIGWEDATGADRTDFFNDVPVKETSGTRYVDIAWTAPLEAMICTTSTVHYKRYNPSSREYVARGQMSTIGHMHFIPENSLGTIGPILALIAGLGVFATTRKRTHRYKI